MGMLDDLIELAGQYGKKATPKQDPKKKDDPKKQADSKDELADDTVKKVKKRKQTIDEIMEGKEF